MGIDEHKDELENNQILFQKIIYDYLISKDKEQILKNLFDFLEKIASKKLNKKEFDDVFSSFIEEDINETINVDTYIKDNIKLEIGTVHSVKGETHIATLYLDTFYKKYDISNYLILEKLLSLKNNLKESKERKNIIFVGASRPKYLLCFACQNILSSLSDQNKEKLEEIFEIVEI